MREIIADTEIKSSGYAARTLRIGKTGENFATVIIFSTAAWVETFGIGVFQLRAQRPTEAETYDIELDTELYTDGVAWIIRSTDVAVPGKGVCELRYFVDDALAKSATYKTIVEPALPAGR